MNNSGVSKIIFEEFPGKRRNKKQKKKVFQNLKINKIVIYIIIGLILFIISSFLNLKYLDKDLNDKYKLVDKTLEDFATIKDRKKLFYDIGFETVSESVKELDSSFYETTEASGNRIMDDYQDKLLVYYDINNRVQKVVFELIFKEEDFAYNNINAVIKNFTNIEINKNMIKKAINNESVSYSDIEKSISLEYKVLSYNYKRLKVEIGRW